MATKFLSLAGLKHFIDKVIGKTSIDGVGDGTVKGAVASMNQRVGDMGAEISTLTDTDSTRVTTNYNTTIFLERKGNLVTFKHSGVMSLGTVGKVYNLATIPEGFRPKGSEYMQCILVTNATVNGNARFEIDSEGKVIVLTSQATAREYLCSMNYFV